MLYRRTNYTIAENSSERIILRDVGPWHRFMTITNAADSVIAELDREHGIGTRKVFYYDSEGELTELLVKDGRFAGFAPA